MTVASLGLVFLIGSLYFVPLSISRGHFTLGESGGLNYLIYVNGAGPRYYMEDPGKGKGRFLHPPQIISASPLVHAFDRPGPEPIRALRSFTMDGGRPAPIDLRSEISTSIANLVVLKSVLIELSVFLAGILVFLTVARGVGANFAKLWPSFLVGIAGVAMYMIVHLEPRYIGAFMVLLCSAILWGFRGVPPEGSAILSR